MGHIRLVVVVATEGLTGGGMGEASCAISPLRTVHGFRLFSVGCVKWRGAQVTAGSFCTTPLFYVQARGVDGVLCLWAQRDRAHVDTLTTFNLTPFFASRS